jgi:hypothetical protein
MGGILTRVVALLLIAFVAVGAQCVTTCSLESIAQPPCHKAPVKSCAHDQAAGNSLKVFQVEAHAIAVVPETIGLVPHEAPVMLSRRPAPSPPSHDTLSTTVLRI